MESIASDTTLSEHHLLMADGSKEDPADSVLFVQNAEFCCDPSANWPAPEFNQEECSPQLHACFNLNCEVHDDGSPCSDHNSDYTNTDNALATPQTHDSEFSDQEAVEYPRPRNFESVVFGFYEIKTWYFSPYPDEFCKNMVQIYVCPRCLKYMRDPRVYLEHMEDCLFVPSGSVIYNYNGIKVVEVYGKTEKLFCQNLCLFAKLFLDRKSVHYDVDPFRFYLMYCVNEGESESFVGFFSKEIYSEEKNNLACVLVFPTEQRKGYGKFLLEFSKTGHPERPLSDLGQRAYDSVWRKSILRVLNDLNAGSEISMVVSLPDIAKSTGIDINDCAASLNQLGLVKYRKEDGTICISDVMLDGAIKRFGKPLEKTINSGMILWK